MKDSKVKAAGLEVDAESWIEFFAKLVPALDGGIPNIGRIFNSAVRLSTDTDHPKGSAVCLADRRWLITAAHCVKGSVEVPLRANVEKTEETGAKFLHVKEIFWQSGHHYLYGGKQDWPTEVNELFADRDELALLRLATPFSSTDVPFPAVLRHDLRPKKRDRIVVAGWGEDVFGNQSDASRAGILRFDQVAQDGRHECVRDPTDLFNAMPVSYDSGCPLFLPRWSNPFSTDFYRLIGVHGGRLTSQATIQGQPRMDDIARSLPLDANALNWIDRITKLVPFPSIQPLQSSVPERPTVTTNEFRLRNHWTCLKLSDVKDMLSEQGGRPIKWELKSPNGPAPTLQQLDEVVFSEGSQDTAKMTIVRGGSPYFEANCQVGGVGGQDHWLYGHDTSKSVEFYVFLLKKRDSDDKRLIHIQVHAKNSTRPRPGPCSIKDADVPQLPCMTFLDHGGIRVDDQDDEGDGHEK